MLSETSPSQKSNIVWFYLYEVSRLVKFRKIEEWWLLGTGGYMGYCSIDYEVLILQDEKTADWLHKNVNALNTMDHTFRNG